MLIEFTLSAPNQWHFFGVISSTIVSIVLPTGRSINKTLSLTISIDTLDSHLARVSWNTAMQRRHVIYQVRCRAGNHVTDIVTSNTTVSFTGLSQLTTYTITVKAQALDGKSPQVSSEIRLTTPGWSPTRIISFHSRWLITHLLIKVETQNYLACCFSDIWYLVLCKPQLKW